MMSRAQNNDSEEIQPANAPVPMKILPATGAETAGAREVGTPARDGVRVAETLQSTMPSPESLSQGLSVTMGASVLSIFIGLINNVAMARILGPEFKGRVDLVISTIGMMATLAGSSLAVGLIYVIAKGQANQRRLAAMMTAAAVVQSLIVWVALAALAHTPWITALVPLPFLSWAIPVIAIGTWAALLTLYWRSFFAGVQRFTACAVLDTAGKLLIAVLMVGCVAAFHDSQATASVAATIGLVVAMLIAGVTAFAGLRAQLRSGTGRAGFGEVFRYSVPCYLGHVVQSLNYRLDVFLIAYFARSEDLGQYVIAVAVGQLLWLPSNAVQAVLFPRLSSTDDDASRARDTARMVRLLLAFSIMLSIALAVAGPYVMVWVFGPRFAASVVPLWLLLPGITVFAATSVLAAFISAIGRPGLNVAVAAVALVATIVLNLLLLPRIGIAGAAIASSVSYTISTVLSLWIFWRKTGYNRWHTIVLSSNDLREIAAWLSAQYARLAGRQAR